MNLKCPKCNHSWNYKGKAKRAQCGSCRYKGIITYIKTTPTTPSTTPTISSDFMSGSLIDALKKTGLDPMKNGQIRDAISSLLEKDEYKIAFADAVEKTHLSPIRLAKKILKDWLKKEGYI